VQFKMIITVTRDRCSRILLAHDRQLLAYMNYTDSTMSINKTSESGIDSCKYNVQLNTDILNTDISNTMDMLQ
jgi:hypothetical protein